MFSRMAMKMEKLQVLLMTMKEMKVEKPSLLTMKKPMMMISQNRHLVFLLLFLGQRKMRCQAHLARPSFQDSKC
jgi:hypothetical protein